jgi:ribonuclease E
MVENENNTNNHEGTPKRRNRLFGGRRAKSAEPEARGGSEPTVDSTAVPADTSSADTSHVEAELVETELVETELVETELVDSAAADTEHDSAAARTTTLAEGTAAGDTLTAPTGGESPDAPPVESAPVESAPVEAPTSSGAPFRPVATSTTSLIFHAPVLPAVQLPPLRPISAPEAEPDSEDDSFSSRRRSRRRGSSEDRGQRQQREPELITEPQRIKGSTRLEAKKQRRRDGRDAGRRRQVITEDEFLARRESVDRKMIVRSSASRLEIAVLEDDVLAEHYITKSHNVSLIGNVYLGKVQNVLPSMEAAFVDIGRGRNAVLYSGEVDWDSVEKGNQPRRIELALKPGDKVLVQVTKDPVGHKGARLTSQISLPGRYLVYVPNGSMNGISRKLPDTERARLKKILKEVLPERAGVIVRTAAEGATEEQLTHDVSRLTSQWEAIQKKVEVGQAPTLLHSEPDLLVKIVRDVFNEDFSKLIIDGDDARSIIDDYLASVAPDLKDRVEIYDGPDSFEEHRINEQVEKALDRKVWLPSGGSLVIDRTEAMTVIDVNTGKFVGSGGNLEETVTKNNLEAAEEIVRQLRLRDIGGIIVVDFIDMVLETNRDLVLRRLVECLSRDRTKHQVAEVTSLGLVQMTRKKIGVGLQESINELNGHGNEPQQEQQPSKNNRNRKSRNGAASNGGGQNGAPSQAAQTHQITDDVKNALSRIAASTVPHHDGAPTSGAEAPSENEVVASVETSSIETLTVEISSAVSSDESPSSEESGRSGRRRGRRGRGGDSSGPKPDELTVPTTPVEEATVDPTATTAPDVAAPIGQTATVDAPAARKSSSGGSRRVRTAAPVVSETPVAILDIPVAETRREPRRVRSEDAESILDSVLQALPEPKQPGQGRNRSRRVSSGSISAPATTDGQDDSAIISS